MSYPRQTSHVPETPVRGRQITSSDINRSCGSHLAGVGIEELPRLMVQVDATATSPGQNPSSGMSIFPFQIGAPSQFLLSIANGTYHNGPPSECQSIPSLRATPMCQSSAYSTVGIPIPQLSCHRQPLNPLPAAPHCGPFITPTTPSPAPANTQNHMKRCMAEHELEDLNRHLAASHHNYGLLQHWFEDTNDRLRVAHLDVRRLEAETNKFRAYEEEYQRYQAEIIKREASREIHIGWVEGCLQEYQDHASKLYRERREADALVAEARQQGFLPPASSPQF